MTGAAGSAGDGVAARLIDRVLPQPQVLRAEVLGDLAGPLHPAEAAAVAGAVEGRRREFTTVRVLARRELARLGHRGEALVPGPGGAPRWPAGVVGSITHCEGYRAVALARAAQVAGLGIDAEPDAPLPDGVLEVVSAARERERGAAAGPEHWSRLLFSAKESAYKAWYPVEGRLLTHADIEVDLGASGTFVARRVAAGVALDLVAAPPLAGRWARAGGFLVTAAVLTPSPRRGRSR